MDTIKKAILTGIGLTALTTDKIKESVAELKERYNLSEREGRELVDEILKKSDEAQKTLEKRIRKEVAKVLDELDLATKSDIKELMNQLQKIEKAIGEKADA